MVYVVRGPPLLAKCRCDNPRHLASGNVSIIGFRRGEGWSNPWIEWPFRKIYRVRKYLFKNPPYEVFWRRPILWISTPLGETRDSHGLSIASERLAMALLLPGRMSPPPTPATNSDPRVPSSPPKYALDTDPTHGKECILGVSNHEKKYRTSRAGDLDASVHIIQFNAPRTKAPRQLLIRGLYLPYFNPPSPQPYKTLHGYTVTNAHYEEVGVTADVHASAPPSEAAAAAPPAGASEGVVC
jgi:hypothetical protein